MESFSVPRYQFHLRLWPIRERCLPVLFLKLHPHVGSQSRFRFLLGWVDRESNASAEKHLLVVWIRTQNRVLLEIQVLHFDNSCCENSLCRPLHICT